MKKIILILSIFFCVSLGAQNKYISQFPNAALESGTLFLIQKSDLNYYNTSISQLATYIGSVFSLGDTLRVYAIGSSDSTRVTFLDSSYFQKAVFINKKLTGTTAQFNDSLFVGNAKVYTARFGDGAGLELRESGSEFATLLAGDGNLYLNISNTQFNKGVAQYTFNKDSMIAKAGIRARYANLDSFILGGQKVKSITTGDTLLTLEFSRTLIPIDSLDNLLDVELSSTIPINSLLTYNGSKWIDSKKLLVDSVSINGTNFNGYLNVTNTIDTGIYVTNTTGKGIYVRNAGSGIGTFSQNTSTGVGNYIINSSSGFGFQSQNSSTGSGIYSINSSSGIGNHIINSSTGRGIYVRNESVGDGLTIQNYKTSKASKLFNIIDTLNRPLFYVKNDTTVINTKIKASNFTDDLGKYNLTINSTTHEVYAQQLAHAFYGFADSARSLSLASNATWYQITNPSKNLFIDFESDYVSMNGDTIILGQAAHWEFHYHVVFTGSTGIWFKMRLFNVTKNQVIPIPTAATAEGTNFTSIGNTAYCTNCDSGDKILLQMIAESNTQTITLIDGSVLIKATHGTK